MKIEFYVETVSYYGEYSRPSVIIVVRDNIENLSPEPIVVRGSQSMESMFKKMFMEESKNHKTSFVVPLEQYRDSGIKVGDKISVEIKIDNVGKIAN